MVALQVDLEREARGGLAEPISAHLMALVSKPDANLFARVMRRL